MSTDNKQLPPVKELFQESWQVFTKSALSLLLLNVFSIVLYLGAAVVAGILFVISGYGSALLKSGLPGLMTYVTTLSLTSLILSVGALALLMIGFIFIASAISTAAILLIDSEGKLPLTQAFKKGLSLVIPLTFVSVLISFLTFGGFFVFIVPAIIMTFLLSFATFEVMLNDKRGVTALKHSVTIISNNFAAILGRWLAIIGVYILVTVIIPNILGSISAELKVYTALASVVVNWVLGWYAMAYNIVLYKQVKDAADRKNEKSIMWMWVVAIIGWAIFGLMVFGIWKFVTSDAFKSGFNQAFNAQNASLLSSVAGMDPKAKEHFAKSQQLFAAIRVNGDNPTAVKKLNDENIAELKAALEIEPNNALLWASLGNAYTWVSSTGTLEEDALMAYKKAEELEPTNTIYIDNVAETLIKIERYDEAVLALQKSLRIGLADGDESGYTHYRLGLAYAGLKVNTSAIEHFNKAIEILESQNKNGAYDDTILAAQKQIAALSQ